MGPCINDVRTEGSPIELIVLIDCMSALVKRGGGSNIPKILQKSLNYGPVWKGRNISCLWRSPTPSLNDLSMGAGAGWHWCLTVFTLQCEILS